MSAEAIWENVSKSVAGVMRVYGAREFRLVDSGGKFHFEVTPDEAKSDFAKLTELNTELVAAIEHYFTTWNNEGKKPGWCARLANARDRVLIAIAKSKEVAA